jgi:hypothetical protein
VLGRLLTVGWATGAYLVELGQDTQFCDRVDTFLQPRAIIHDSCWRELILTVWGHAWL